MLLRRWACTTGHHAYGSFAPCDGCINTKTVTITDPLGHVVVNTYGTKYAFNERLLMGSNEGNGLKVTGNAYRAANAGPYPPGVGSRNALPIR